MISKTEVHALTALAALARIPNGGYAGAGEIAKTTGAPRNYLGKLLKVLGHEGLVESQKGNGEGFRLPLFCLARTYTRASDPKAIVAEWDDKRVPHLVRADEAVAFTRVELSRQEEKFQQQIATQNAQIEAREASIAESNATLAQREAALAQVNAELAALRAELAQAKAANLAVPDTHDYDEADTRRFLIDVLLREAGWEVDRSMSMKCRSPACPTGRARASSTM